MVDVSNNFASPLTVEILFSWYEMLMTQNKNLSIGAWRTHKEPMQVVSGAIGEEKIHFEAPPSEQVPAEMQKFIQWFNDTSPGKTKEIKRAPFVPQLHIFTLKRSIRLKMETEGLAEPLLKKRYFKLLDDLH